VPRTLDAKHLADHTQTGKTALDRLQASIDAAEIALKDLRSEIGRDSRDLLTDLDKTLRDARRNLTRSRKRILKDLEQIPRAMVSGEAARPAATRPARPRTGARRPRTGQTIDSRNTTTTTTSG